MTDNARLSTRLVVTAILLLGAGALYVVGGAGYGLAAEYGNPAEGGMWQIVAIGAVVVGAVWGGLAVLILRVSDRSAHAFLVLGTTVAVCLVAGVVGGQLGSASHAAAEEARSTACTDGVGAEMRELADVARPEASPYRARPQGTPEGCVIDIAVPNDLGDDYDYVTGRVEAAGFRPDGEDGWVRGDLTVRMRSEAPEGGREHLVVLTGTRG